MTYLVVSLDKPEFMRKLNSMDFPVKDLLMWVEKAALCTSMEMVSKMKAMSKRKPELKESQFVTSASLALRELKWSKLVTSSEPH